MGIFRRWLRTALKHSIGTADLWGGVISAAIVAMNHFWPQVVTTNSLWLIPISALLGVVAVRLLMAPYWMAKKDATEIAQLKAKLSDRAHLEIRFSNLEPYRRTDQDNWYWSFGVHNNGPAVADNVIAELCSIVPAPTPTVSGLSYPITPHLMAVDVLECRINPASDAQFWIARMSKTNTVDEWVVSQIGTGGGFSASFNMDKQSKFDMSYRVHAANAEEQLFTISVSVEENNIILVRK